MAIHRGIQSAIFYYLSCAPCSEARIRKQRKEEAKRDRAARLALEEELPNLYRQPSPSSTNPHWQVEIALGPTLAGRGKRKTNGGAARASSNASGVPSSVNLPPGSSDGRNDSKLNLRQREDEVLWGSSTCGGEPSGSADGIRRPPTARTIDSSKSHRTFRNPPINELHPATVTRVTSREEVMWMMQPPPVAEFMSGKEPASSGRSIGGRSRTSRKSPSATPLSIAVSDCTLDNTLQVGSPPSLGLSRQNSSRASNGIDGQRHDRSSATNERDFAFALPQRQVSKRDKQQTTMTGISQDSTDSTHTVLRAPALAPDAVQRRPSQPARPQLSTIVSDSLYPADSAASTRFHTPDETPTKENLSPTLPTTNRKSNREHEEEWPNKSEPSRRASLAPPPQFLVHENSLKLIQQDLSPGPGPLINAKFYATAEPTTRATLGDNDTLPATAPALSRQVRLHSRDESSGDDVILSVQPEIFERLHSPEFELPEWIHEHTKREGVRERWSMDL